MARIFIVEDDRTIAELLQVALQHDGHEVWLDMIGDLSVLDETFDLVLLDLTRPGRRRLVLGGEPARETSPHHDTV